MKPGILLRLIVSVVVAVAFVLGATVAEASNSLNPTALWWAQRQLPLLWMVDGFALLALLPVFGSAILKTRLAHKSEEMTQLRSQHETQMEDVIQHSEATERINIQQAKSLEALEGTVEALSVRLNAMEADNKAHQENMEAEARRLAVEAFTTLAGEVQANTRQMEAVSLAMQYQRAEIKQLRQNVRATQRPQEITEIARLTPYELAALEGENPPLMLEDGGEEKEKRRQGEGEKIQDTRYKIQEGEDSSFILGVHPQGRTHPSSLSEPPKPDTEHPTPSLGFFEPTMNAQTTFVSPTAEFEITAAASEPEADTELFAAPSERTSVQEEVPADELASSKAVVTPEEYHYLHGAMDGEETRRDDYEPQTGSKQTNSDQPEPQQPDPPRGLRRWFMRL